MATEKYVPLGFSKVGDDEVFDFGASSHLGRTHGHTHEGHDLDAGDTADTAARQARIARMRRAEAFQKGWKAFSEGFSKVVGWTARSTIFPSTFSLLKPAEDDRFVGMSLLDVVKRQVVKAYGVDGLDQQTGFVVCADGTSMHITDVTFGWKLVSFLGLPSRPASAQTPNFSFLQLARNFIGGWNQVKETITGQAINADGHVRYEVGSEHATKDSLTQRRWTEKKIFLATFFWFKATFIALFKLVTWPFKLMLNVVKLATEVVLPLVSHFTALINARGFAALTVWLAQKTFGYIPKNERRISIDSISLDDVRTRKFRFGLRQLIAFPFAFSFLVAAAAVTLAVGIAQYAMLLASRMGLALTSPQKSAEMAFKAGKTFPIGPEWFKTAIGAIGYVLSLGLSAVLWTITLPLAVGALTTAIPALLTAVNWVAQLPVVASSLAWLSSTQLVIGSTALLNSFFATVGVPLAAAFGPAVYALAGVIGAQVSTTVLVVGTALGMIVTPAAAVLNQVADKLSDLWAKWVEQRPVHALINWVKTPRKKEGHEESVPLMDEIASAKAVRAEPEAKPIRVPGEFYLYQEKGSNMFIARTRPLNLVLARDEAVKGADDAEDAVIVTSVKAEEAVHGIRVYGANPAADAIWRRAVNNVDHSRSQGAYVDEDYTPPVVGAAR